MNETKKFSFNNRDDGDREYFGLINLFFLRLVKYYNLDNYYITSNTLFEFGVKYKTKRPTI